MSNLLETTQQIYAAFGQGNVPGILDHLADDVAWESWADNTAQKLGVPWLQARQGKQGAAEFFTYIGMNTEVREFSVLSMMVGERSVAVEFVIELFIPATGRRSRDEEVHLWSFNERGQVTRLRHYTDTAKHIYAAGLS